MANLKTESQNIEIIINDTTYYYQQTDKKAKEFRKFQKETAENLGKVQKKLSNSSENDLFDSIDEANKELGGIFDFLLGEGAYEKLYKETPSIIAMIPLLVDVMDAISEDLTNRQQRIIDRQQELIQKYRKKK